MRGCRLPGLRSSWPGSPLGARLLSQEKRATETHFGFETVSEEEKGGKGEGARGRRGQWPSAGLFLLPAQGWLNVVLCELGAVAPGRARLCRA